MIHRFERKLEKLRIAKEKQLIKEKIKSYSVEEIRSFVFDNHAYTLYELVNDKGKVITKILDIQNLKGIGRRTYVNDCDNDDIDERFISMITNTGVNYIHIYENAVDEMLKEIEEEKKRRAIIQEKADRLDEIYNSNEELQNKIEEKLKEEIEEAKKREYFIVSAYEIIKSVFKDAEEEVICKTKL